MRAFYKVEADGIEPTTSSLPGGRNVISPVPPCPSEAVIHLHIGTFYLDYASPE